MPKLNSSESENRLSVMIRDKMVYRENWTGKIKSFFGKEPPSSDELFHPESILIKTIINLIHQTPGVDWETQQPPDFWDLLWNGMLKGVEMRQDLPGRNVDPEKLRLRAMELWLQEPRLIELIVCQQVTTSHYTGTASLESILKHGLLGRKQQRELAVPPMPNGHLDSDSNERYVSLNQWHNLGFEWFFFPTYRTDGTHLISPLTKETISEEIEVNRQKTEDWYEMYDQKHESGGKLTFELRVEILLKNLANYDATLKALASDLSRELFIANEPLIFLTTEPDDWRIPHSDIRTEIMTPAVPAEKIKAVIIPGKRKAQVDNLITEFQLPHEYHVFELEKFRPTKR